MMSTVRRFRANSTPPEEGNDIADTSVIVVAISSCEKNSRFTARAADCFIGGSTHDGGMSRLRSTLLCALMVTSLFLGASMSVAADGEDIVIDSQVEWVEDRTLEGDVRVVAGGELTINGLNLVVSDDSQIIVDE